MGDIVQFKRKQPKPVQQDTSFGYGDGLIDWAKALDEIADTAPSEYCSPVDDGA